MTREQDARVAAALGWTAAHAPYDRLGTHEETHWFNPAGTSAELPHYSTDLAAAWTLVEQCYSGCVERLSNGDVYEAYLVIERDGKNADSYASASTPAAAIVAAFLAAVEA